jgi:hypothetical protein
LAAIGDEQTPDQTAHAVTDYHDLVLMWVSFFDLVELVA